MAHDPTRRRLLRIFAAALACAAAPGVGADEFEWHGSALGADVSLGFAGGEPGAAEAAIARILAEVDRLEAIFSLQRADSELCRLNAAGRLEAPSPDLVYVLTTARRIHAATAGRFDPTVQPLWAFHRDWYGRDRARARPSEADLAAVRAAVGFERVRVAAAAVETAAGTRLTLNGIAQGHVTDRATAILRDAGFAHVLVDLGEIRALGPKRDGEPWRIGLGDGRQVQLGDGAVATSSGSGLRFADNGDHHLFDPVTGRPAAHWDWLTVAHPSAMVADGFSTGLFVLPPPEAERMVRATPDLALWGRTATGETVTVAADGRLG